MRVGMSSAVYYSLFETEDAVTEMRKYGLPVCEVFLETFSEYNKAFGETVRRNLHGMEAVSVHARTQHYEADILAAAHRQRADGLVWLAGVLDAANALGAAKLVYHGPAALRGERRPIAGWADRLNYALDFARSKGVQICWETVSWCAINDPSRVTEAIECCPSIAFTIDIKQVIETRHPPAEYIRNMGRHLHHFHAMDYDANGKHALPGRGITDFRELGNMLRDMGYQGDIILEPYSWMIKDDGEMRRSIEYLREAFEV